jgi:hypothetical protein
MAGKQQGASGRILWLGIGIGILISALALTGYWLLNRQPMSATQVTQTPERRLTLTDLTGDLLDQGGQRVANAPTYLDIVGATIQVSARQSYTGATTAANHAAAPILASVTISMAAPAPPTEQARIFSLGVSIDGDGDASNNDPQTPALRGTDTTIAINCDPKHGRCLEGIATFANRNWTLQAKEITWQIKGNVVQLTFLLDFLTVPPDQVGWRVFATLLDEQVGGPAATDVAPAEDAPLARLP